MSNPEHRFWPKVDATGICWEWTRGKNRDGYGRFNDGSFVWLAHRYAWTILVGPIPDGFTLDHLCRVHSCVNPDHNELVTLAENKRRGYSSPAINARKTVCKRGHDLTDPANLRPRRYRQCRLCHVLDERARRKERR
jgi:hypothetical protein